jgi:hypothetical protein
MMDARARTHTNARTRIRTQARTHARTHTHNLGGAAQGKRGVEVRHALQADAAGLDPPGPHLRRRRRRRVSMRRARARSDPLHPYTPNLNPPKPESDSTRSIFAANANTLSSWLPPPHPLLLIPPAPFSRPPIQLRHGNKDNPTA